MAAISSWQTRANAVTALRLLAAPGLVSAICAGRPDLGLLFMGLAILTDFADGWVARRYQEVSPLGGLVDHSVDATFVTAGTATYAMLGVLPTPLAPLIVAAFLQYAIDSRAGMSRPLRASSLGRWNGIAYYVVVAVPLVRDTLGLGFPSPALLMGLGWVLVVSTLASMADRYFAAPDRA